jgi:hypothetical protein
VIQQHRDERRVQRGTNNPQVVGGIDGVKTIVGFALDTDAGKGDVRYVTLEVLWEAMHRMPCLPTMFVQTKGRIDGGHTYWKFAEPIRLAELSIAERVAEVGRINSIAAQWRGLLCRKVAEVVRESETVVPENDVNCLIDVTSNVDRVLRPVGATRNTGDTVRLSAFNPENRYTLEQLTVEGFVPDTREQIMARMPSDETPTGDAMQRPIGQHLSRNQITVELLLVEAGYTDQGSGNWQGPNSTHGRSVHVSVSRQGTPGLTCWTASNPPLTNEGGNGQGRWYNIVELYVMLRHNGDWIAAAIACRPNAEEASPDMSDEMDARPAQKPRLIVEDDLTGEQSQTIANYLLAIGRNSPWVTPARKHPLFRFGGRWAQVTYATGQPVVSMVSRDRIVGLISDAVKLERKKEGKNGTNYVPIVPPKEIVGCVFGEPSLDAPEIVGVARKPILRPEMAG